jgi:hypothetical protein
MTSALERRLARMESTAPAEAPYIGGWYYPGKGWMVGDVVVSTDRDNLPTHYEGKEVIWGAWMDIGGPGQ